MSGVVRFARLLCLIIASSASASGAYAQSRPTTDAEQLLRLQQIDPATLESQIDVLSDFNKQVVSPSRFQSAAHRKDVGQAFEGRNETEWGVSRTLPQRNAQECDKAADLLIAFLAGLQSDGRLAKFYRTFGDNLRQNEKELQSFVKLVAAYDRACLYHFSDLTAEAQEFLGPRTALLLYDGVPYCSAFMFSSKVAITAAHCGDFDSLTRIARGWWPNEIEVLNPIHGLAEHRDSENDYPVGHTLQLVGKFEEILQAKGRNFIDFVPISTTRSDASMPALDRLSIDRLSEANNKSKLLLISFNLLVHISNILGDGKSHADWREAVRWSQDACEPVILHNGCIVHGCQAEKASSGAGIIQDGNFVGIHLGAMATNTVAGPCEEAYVKGGNFGVQIEKDLLLSDDWIRELAFDLP